MVFFFFILFVIIFLFRKKYARLGTSNSIKSTGVKLVYGPKPLLLVNNVLNVLNIYIYIPKIKITKGVLVT
jgi:hypothetical protein